MQAILTQPRNSYNPLPLLILIGIAVLAGIALMSRPPAVTVEDDTTLMVLHGVEVDFSKSHGVIEHPGEYEAVKHCIEQNGVFSKWINPATGHNIDVCQFPDGKFGLFIFRWAGDKIEDLTGFIKQKAKDWAQVERYLRNSGAIPR